MAGPSNNNNQHEELRREIDLACSDMTGIQAGMEALRALVDRLDSRLIRLNEALKRRPLS